VARTTGITLDSQVEKLLSLIRQSGRVLEGRAAATDPGSGLLAALLAFVLASRRHVMWALDNGLTARRIVRWFEDLIRADPATAEVVWDHLADNSAVADTLRGCRQIPADREAVHELVLTLLAAPKPRPDNSWLDRAARVRGRLPACELRAALIALARLGPEWEKRISMLEGSLPSTWLDLGTAYPDLMPGGERSEIFLLPANPLAMTIARGAIWMLADFPDDETRNLLESAARSWARSGLGSPALGLAAISALARAGDEEAMRRLLRLRAPLSHRTLLARINKEIETLAARLNTSPDALADRLVPRHGLDAAGERAWTLGGYGVTLRLTARGAVEQTVTAPDGRVRRTLPAAVRRDQADAWAEIKAETAALRATVGAQRARFEEAMVAGRAWRLAAWQEDIEHHPILGNLARRLVWRFGTPGGQVRFAFPETAGAWRDATGSTVTPSPDASLAVVHPVDLPDEERARWQTEVVQRGVVQPFKQLFRETYVVTPAERAAGYVSTRFTGLPVSAWRVYALTRGRGWAGPLGQTDFDGAGEGWREFPTYGVRCHLQHSVERDRLITVEWVRFERAVGAGRRREWEPIRLADVPAIPFSEAMRDIDLIVSVSAMGTEAEWQAWDVARQRGEARWAEQIARYQAIQSEIAAMRAALLQRLLPVMGLADAVEVDRHFALVQGRLGRYRVHLGTGNVHVEPDGRYICIVPAHEGRPIVLPFEDEDAVTSTILSTIALLANDAVITDPGIKAQLPGRVGP
jgi:hypothetical protein